MRNTYKHNTSLIYVIYVKLRGDLSGDKHSFQNSGSGNTDSGTKPGAYTCRKGGAGNAYNSCRTGSGAFLGNSVYRQAIFHSPNPI